VADLPASKLVQAKTRKKENKMTEKVTKNLIRISDVMDYLTNGEQRYYKVLFLENYYLGKKFTPPTPFFF
jgi:hypothetical protein